MNTVTVLGLADGLNSNRWPWSEYHDLQVATVPFPRPSPSSEVHVTDFMKQ